MALKLFSRKKAAQAPQPTPANETAGDSKGSATTAKMPLQFVPAPRENPESDLLRRLHQQCRHNVILRDEAKWRSHQGGTLIIQKVKQELEQRMALVPAGRISLPLTLSAAPGGTEEDHEIAPFLISVHTVTNSRFQKFVDAGGYDELEYWPEEIWPHLIEFKDLTGSPGPRFWRNSRHNTLLADHPVAGVSWYEAQAYALWIGQRLPTEMEWQMTASWHINSSADLVRRFPWGDSLDGTRCNIWSSRHAATVPVNEYPRGAAPNHVLQLIGNVWEWTDTEFNITDDEGRPIVGEIPMHAVRGGAFDTYFETQATSHFRTGQIALARTANTGFRTAMDLSEATWMNTF